ncbi:hypothetical protein NZK35_15155 [Stieleria sp. ICT_E10.1]|nr:hypothetical protein [Stieleria sedimenti]MCS7467991.1 hypothetical protein [Stieleria sedimenti]
MIPEAIIAERANQLGSEYAILRQADAKQYNAQLADIAFASRIEH